MNPADIKSGMWTDPRGYLCRLSAATPAAYRQLCQAKLVQGWHPAEPYPEDGVVMKGAPPSTADAHFRAAGIYAAAAARADDLVVEIEKATGDVSALVQRASEAVTVPIKRSRK